MKILTSQESKGLNLVLSIVFAFSLIFFSTLFTQEAKAQGYVVPASLPVPIDKAQPATSNYVESSVMNLIDETQKSYEQAMFDLNGVLSKLPEELGIENRAKELENNQDTLEKVADEIETLGEKVANFNTKYQEYGVLNDKEIEKNLKNLQVALEKTSKNVDSLAHNVERAEGDTSKGAENAVEQKILKVKESLEASDKAFKTFAPNPA